MIKWESETFGTVVELSEDGAEWAVIGDEADVVAARLRGAYDGDGHFLRAACTAYDLDSALTSKELAPFAFELVQGEITQPEPLKEGQVS